MSGLVDYPCPLGAGRFAHLHLPSDLTASDVVRLIAFLYALAPEPVSRETPDDTIGPVGVSDPVAP